MDLLQIILVLIPVALGSGGLGSVIATNIANRKKTEAEAEKAEAEAAKIKAEVEKVKADIVDTLAEHYAFELTALRNESKDMKCQIANLNIEIAQLKSERKSGEVTIETLTKKNMELTSQVRELTEASEKKDARILELEKQVAVIPGLEKRIAELTARLDAFNGKSNCD